ncbi:MAG TPA: LysR family transcriptional regulator [Geopsychrobacteraceae bacterium]|nr:LysR family transcriptional regulator [Geopsychrobacteraceae bacterium]
MSQIRLRRKIWLEVDGEPLLGYGRARLLNAIADSGSISAACQLLGISYRRAWAKLQKMEKQAPFAILERHKGGKGGGGTTLTKETISLLQQYAELTTMIDTKLQECNSKQFDIPEIDNL